jgi:UDP-N-acetylmuramoyl-tripeptide--D-alanyl-D-alanine ligase
MEIINRPDRVKIINDTYNASPSSMTAALKVLAGTEGRKIALLGDMLELGRSAESSHKKIGQLARKLGIDILICVGKLSRAMKGDYHFGNNLPALKRVKSLLHSGDVLLVKASRGMRLEEIVEAIRNI